VDQLRDAGYDVADNDLAHLGPTMTEHLNVHGRYYFDLIRTLKPLRPGRSPSRLTGHDSHDPPAQG
jgi:hypothetical protein